MSWSSDKGDVKCISVLLFPVLHLCTSIRYVKEMPMINLKPYLLSYCLPQGSFPSTLESSRSTRHHGLVERVQRDRRFISPVRPYRNRQVSFSFLSIVNPQARTGRG